MLYYPHAETCWGVVNNTGYNGMPISLGILWTLIHCLRRDQRQKNHVHPDILACQLLTLQTAPPVPLKAGTSLPVRYIFISSMLKKHQVWPHGKVFIFNKSQRPKKLFLWKFANSFFHFKQGWEFAHLFFEQIARFLWLKSNSLMSGLMASQSLF